LQDQICIIGLGYVGLPLAVAFGRHRPTLGFDTDAQRIAKPPLQSWPKPAICA
jgi:UDP-N-acetyl-D-galactosamine dehydrogenase